MIILIHQPADRVAAGSDISRLLVDPYMANWSLLEDMSLPVNAQRILDTAPAANAYGRG